MHHSPLPTLTRTCACNGCATPALRQEQVCLEHWTQYRINALMGDTPEDIAQREADRRARIRRWGGHM